MKTLFWIDDDISLMKLAADNLFQDIWKKEYVIRVILVGDNFRSEGRGTHVDAVSMNEFTERIEALFRQYCRSKIDSSFPTEKKVSEKYKRLYPERPIHIQEAQPERALKQIIDRVENEDEACICLDLRLYNNDMDWEGGSLSMRLYNHFRTTTLLFSTFDDVRNKNNWRKRYEEIFGESNEEIRIFSRNEIASKGSDEQEKFLSMIP